MQNRQLPLVRWSGSSERRPGGTSLHVAGLALVLACNSVSARTASAKTFDFDAQSASAEVRQVVSWISDSGDNGKMPYVIVDKVNAKVFVFDAGGHFQGADPALLGMARGDGSVKGIGDRKIAAIRERDRTTPAGRFLVSVSRDVHGQEILLIDYAASIALHPVVKGQPAEQRAQRLQSPTSKDNRISYGCINVPVKFYENVVSPAFANSGGLVYILPEMSKASELFGSYDINVGVRRRDSAQR